MLTHVKHSCYFRLYFLEFSPHRIFPILINVPSRQLWNLRISPDNYVKRFWRPYFKACCQCSKSQTNAYTRRPCTGLPWHRVSLEVQAQDRWWETHPLKLRSCGFIWAWDSPEAATLWRLLLSPHVRLWAAVSLSRLVRSNYCRRFISSFKQDLLSASAAAQGNKF